MFAFAAQFETQQNTDLGGTAMDKNISGFRKTVISITAASLIFAGTASALAQHGFHPSHPHFPPPPHHHGHGHYNDFDRTLGVIGAVGAIAAFANGSPYAYSRPVVVVPSQPVVVERPVVIEKPVVVERPVAVVPQPSVPQYPSTVSADSYVPSLGAAFVIQKMQIPGYKFTAARLITDPSSGSPLLELGLERGDVITRLDDEQVVSFDALRSHEKTTLVRYIKAGTVKVKLGKIYIKPVNTVDITNQDDIYYTP
ncbi:hypothetical protein FACS18942_02930 [Planctomycetales bacterium]|nr:hypothetical protein FACS18942_02930 [Planctomycetales bacterium]GHT35079.1 hypothetical protein FACS189427_03620 [Planctomycetales bacterium]